MPREDYTAFLLRHEATSCKAEKALILESLRAERQARLTIAINLLIDKRHKKSAYHYRCFRESSKVLKALTGNIVYDRYSLEHWRYQDGK